MDTPNILLVDGHNLLFKSFHGVPARVVGRDGAPINAIVGFVGSVRRFIQELKITHLFVAFDAEGESWRDALFDGYKGARLRDYSGESADRNPFEQLGALYRVLDHLGWRHCECPGYEADDVIASFATAWSGLNVSILSSDTDLLQVVSETVVVYRSGLAKGPTTVRGVHQRYGIAPSQIVDYKALVGDPTDGIPGVPGVGQKTAAWLLAEYGSIEEVYRRVGELKPRVGRALQGAQVQVANAQRLIRCSRTTPALQELDTLRVSAPKRGTMEILRECHVL
jgi:DNA polymerase-1